jgi:hypothetical protein
VSGELMAPRDKLVRMMSQGGRKPTAEEIETAWKGLTTPCEMPESPIVRTFVAVAWYREQAEKLSRDAQAFADGLGRAAELWTTEWTAK